MKRNWPLTPLGEVLTERHETPSDDDLISGRVRIIEKISFEKGRISLRAGGSTKTGMIQVRPGDLVVSGINAAKGAIAIYDPDSEAPVAATIHYSAYVANPDRVDTRFLWWMLRSQIFQNLLHRYVPGGIKTELKAKRLLPIPIPLPPTSAQRQIVAIIESCTHDIEEATSLRQQIAAKTEALTLAHLRTVAASIDVRGRLGDILLTPPRNGWSARCDNSDDGTPILSLAAVTGFRYRRKEYKTTSLFADPGRHYWLRPGDMLITRSNTPALVGHVAIYDGSPNPCIYPDLMMRLEPDDTRVFRKFVWYWLQSPVAREFIGEHAKGTSPTMKKISQDTVTKIPFPTTLSRSEQQAIVSRLDVLNAEIVQLKDLQAETAVELDALLSTILDRALNSAP